MSFYCDLARSAREGSGRGTMDCFVEREREVVSCRFIADHCHFKNTEMFFFRRGGGWDRQDWEAGN